MATVREHFDNGPPHAVSIDIILRAHHNGGDLQIPTRVHLDFTSRSIFSSIYFPPISTKLLARIVEQLVSEPNLLIDFSGTSHIGLPSARIVGNASRLHFRRDNDHLTVSFQPPGDDVTTHHELTFTRHLRIYSSDEIQHLLREELRLVARAADMTLSFYGPIYAAETDKLQPPRAFISHDSRDKDEIARPLALGLQKLLCPVWYDEFTLNVGDSLRESIERGLKTCRHCIIVLTPNFLSKGGWPKREYDTAFTREVLTDTRVFLPVWHNASKEDVYEYSPILADRLGVNWSLGADEVCRRLLRAIDNTERDAGSRASKDT